MQSCVYAPSIAGVPLLNLPVVWGRGAFAIVGLGMIVMTPMGPVPFARRGNSFGCGAAADGVGVAAGRGGKALDATAEGGGDALFCVLVALVVCGDELLQVFRIVGCTTVGRAFTAVAVVVGDC